MTAQRRRAGLGHLAGGVVAVLAITACQATGGGDKTGSEAVVLRLASIDQVNDTGQAYGPEAFVAALSEVSGGELQVEVVTDYGGGTPSAESDLVEAIASGDLDGGWPATRAFAGAGIGGLEAVEAPMTLTSYAAQRELVTSPVADDLLGSLDGSGVLGLGLAVGPLRRPFAAEGPLLEPADWAGIRFRSYNSPVQSEVIAALGGEPVEVGFGGWVEQVAAGELRGAELDVAQYLKNGLGTEAGNVTANVVLWPKVFVLSIGQDRFDGLTGEQQGWVREAAGIAVQASVDGDYDEDTAARELCTRGVTFHEASAEQLAELRTAVQPTIDRLAADPQSGPVLAAIQAIAAAHDQTDVPDPVGDCVAGEDAFGPAPDAPSAFPDGVYRVEVTAEDVVDAGITDGGGWSGTWTLTVEDATFQLSCRPLDDPGRDCGTEVSDAPLEAGHLRGTGRTVYFVDDDEMLSRLTGCRLPAASGSDADQCFSGPTYRMTWELSGDTLRLTDYVAEDNWANHQYLLNPWRKIS
jgi:TRAP-type C4-dicarboxylate transport system substrate-binding protein